MDKTTRIVRQMIDEKAEQQKAKNDRLRIARLEREANTPVKAPAPKRKARAPKAAK